MQIISFLYFWILHLQDQQTNCDWYQNGPVSAEWLKWQPELKKRDLQPVKRCEWYLINICDWGRNEFVWSFSMSGRQRGGRACGGAGGGAGVPVSPSVVKCSIDPPAHCSCCSSHCTAGHPTPSLPLPPPPPAHWEVINLTAGSTISSTFYPLPPPPPLSCMNTDDWSL